MTLTEHIPLAPLTTLRIGGTARYFCAAKSERDVLDAIAFAKKGKLPFFILGGGSNLLVSDKGFPGVVIKIELRGIEEKGELVTAFAGENWDDFVAYTVRKGYWGLENLSAIPGTVGAAPVQNIGAYGVEVMQLIDSVRVIDANTGMRKTMSNAECGFSYRESVFKKPESKHLIITSVIFKLSKIPRPNLSYKDVKEYFAKNGISNPLQSDIREAVTNIRRGKFPNLAEIGTAGSFWKNPIISKSSFDALKSKYPELPAFPAEAPAGSRDVGVTDSKVKIPLAWILDRVCNLKGYCIKNAALYEKQPLVLVAKFGATASEIDAFVSEVAANVKEKTGIEIEREVRSLK